MAYYVTADLGLELADPLTVQAFETTNVNSNFELLEAGIVADRVRLTATEADITALEAQHAIVGTVTQFTVASLAALDALATAVVGDEAVFSAAPSTGISFEGLKAQAIAGSGATIDWRFTSDIYAATKANLDTFIAAVVAITDLATGFVIGGQALALDTGIRYRFTSTAGAYAAMPGLILPSAATNGTVTDGVVTSTAQSLVRIRDAFPAGFRVFRGVFDVTMSAAASLQFKFASDATDISTEYDNQYGRHYSTTTDATQALNQTSGAMSPIAPSGVRHLVDITFFAPNVAVESAWLGSALGTVDPMTTGSARSAISGQHRAPTPYNSLTLLGSSGNVTLNHATLEGVS